MNIREIAKRAKVSTATVSRTINRIPTVDPRVAKRVWKVIEESGYRPNIQARALVSGRSHILGLVVSEIINPFFPEIVQAARSVIDRSIKTQPEEADVGGSTSSLAAIIPKNLAQIGKRGHPTQSMSRQASSVSPHLIPNVTLDARYHPRPNHAASGSTSHKIIRLVAQVLV